MARGWCASSPTCGVILRLRPFSRRQICVQFGVDGFVPRIVIRIEWLAGLPHGQNEVQEFAHGVSDSDARMVGMLGAGALVERASVDAIGASLFTDPYGTGLPASFLSASFFAVSFSFLAPVPLSPPQPNPANRPAITSAESNFFTVHLPFLRLVKTTHSRISAFVSARCLDGQLEERYQKAMREVEILAEKNLATQTEYRFFLAGTIETV